MTTEKFQFPGSDGQLLAASLDLPDGAPVAYALFAHCFTCGQNVLAAKRIAEGLAKHGIATLRFDFTGIGASEGEFANTTFSSNITDLVLAADHLRKTRRAPSILIGHSLGGAAILAATSLIPEAKCVATVGAPSDPSHVTHWFKEQIPEIREKGEIEVSLAGRPFRIKREFLDDIAEHRLTETVSKLHKPLLIFHSPTDNTVGINNATHLFVAAKHPKSFISLTGADHLLSQKRDAVYVADMIAAWAMRYLDAPEAVSDTVPEMPDGVVVQESRATRLQQTISAGKHRMIADEPESVGGHDTGPAPYDFLLASLGACTSMTMRLYAERKSIPLDRITVALKHGRIYAKDCEDCETKEGMISKIDRVITMDGNLDAEQRKKLMEIADKCPVHRTLTSEIKIVTTAKD
ncbi:MAG: OsmC family protein [Afipia sp.]|nr:MAG: OsmC family protein [Afipia sp.]